MAERSFKKEVELLRLGDGDTFEGEGILAVTKALLQSGVSYVGGYQGAPVSHLMDVLNDARPIMHELGVHVETCASEAGAAAMLGASVNYPVRGAATWKSTVGTNVASDALSNLASAGVTGGAMIVIGEDYGEGSSIIQERSHAFAMKSQIWLLDPRPNLPSIVKMVEQGFELSEASSTPVMLELRIRACHVHGRFATKDNRRGTFSGQNRIADPSFDYGRICLPPATYVQEKDKIERRWPAAVNFIRDHDMNEVFHGSADDVGIVCQGGMYNAVIRALQQVGLADAFGESAIPIYCLNVTYPLVPSEVTAFCASKRAVLMVEEGQPAYLEEAVNAILRKSDVQTRVMGKGLLPTAGEYTGEAVLHGVARFVEGAVPKGVDLAPVLQRYQQIVDAKAKAVRLLGEPIPTRPPGFCTGCPERPVFSAMKLAEQKVGKFHVSADIGCHTFSTLPPFNIGNTVLGYGLGLASSTGIGPNMDRRVVSVMGDGGFWHNGLTSGVANAVFNDDDGVLVIMNNGYTSATGHQAIPSSVKGGGIRSGAFQPDGQDIERALRGVGVKWIRHVRTYSVSKVIGTLRDAMTTKRGGLKVIIADGECQLARQRRIRPEVSAKVKAGNRVVRTRFGVDEDVCTGDHSCIRLSGCPSLSVKPTSDPLRDDPVAHVNNDCVGCGLCGEVSHAAVLCPSFFKADIVRNPGRLDRWRQGLRDRVISRLSRSSDATRQENAA
ncbi:MULTISPECIES: indolepyruvate ferredoxin oxidoreductase subunit alpha [unclassified Minwuia]|jgi:indolepyruvate ferredoxin oxidoreductase, alpha subunit|uniref:indolepyruvate ferredoxin oxidoreductase subunit alpha n=1 Tax=unclassified Minwuia TaxID=2618799 RepID=UPI0024799DDB|nr:MULTISPECIES: indolepyruvate ferredoxin oxidoreductase subunit alpha [unclassified Minwuia]